ncbi:hypothetical protein [Nocardioides sp. SYSU D00038]|uniref:hypothetical protein n=1 Tax=Nocardioides sp. SYSU D00038 TaxID=2812554 RepID=UPI0019670090|nr:hypothetical protein [Nocardioides sp. SYSU D00038]
MVEIQAAPAVPVGRVAWLVGAVVLLVTMMTWVYLVMRDVMGVGGSCADGGPYVSAQPCPEGVWMMPVGIPVMMLTAFAGTAVAIGLGAPDLLSLMWVGLFGSLGWNFMDFGLFDGSAEAGWIVCGVLFWLMAAPVLYVVLPVGRGSGLTARVKENRLRPPLWWLAIYLVLALVGITIGTVTHAAWS